MKIPEGLKCEITPELAYPNGVPEIPDGFEFVRFGYAKTGEMYLLTGSQPVRAVGNHAEVPRIFSTPPERFARIIVRKTPQPPRQMRSPGGYVHNEELYCEQMGCVPICESKPITRQRVDELARRYGPQLHLMTVGNFIITVLRSLGIEVED